jgi:hypothetical protein
MEFNLTVYVPEKDLPKLKEYFGVETEKELGEQLAETYWESTEGFFAESIDLDEPPKLDWVKN